MRVNVEMDLATLKKIEKFRNKPYDTIDEIIERLVREYKITVEEVTYCHKQLSELNG